MTYDKNFDYRVATLIFTKDQLAALGSVVIESTACEELVESLIWNLSRLTEDQGKFFTSSINMNSRLELLSSLGKPLLRSETKKTEFAKLISDLKEANGARNIVVHGKWQTDGVGILTVMQDGPEKHPPAIVKKRRLNIAPLTRGAAEMEAIALTLASLTSELMSFSRSWRRVPSPEKQLQQELTRIRSHAQTQPKNQAKKPRPKHVRGDTRPKVQ